MQLHNSPLTDQDQERGCVLMPTTEALAAATAALLAGDIVGMPTETVYGLAADATNGMAVARIYEAKGRPSFNPLISHVASLAEAEKYGVFNADARKLAEAFWPGPLTLVVPYREGSGVSDLARAGLDTIALRVPSHPVALALLQQCGRPLAAPSANLSGRISPTQAVDVAHDLGDKVAIVLDGGPCDIGLESTVVLCDGERSLQLRPGGIPRESLEMTLRHKIAFNSDLKAYRSPGMLVSHYAPLAPMRLNALSASKGECVLAFGQETLHCFSGIDPVLNLSPDGDLRQAAARLFSALRELDAYNPAAIAVAPIPSHGLGEAINDRLARAAAPRDAKL
ncbi:MAG: L-threonylcarbamoyladenylate synthase [Beijerinckiaceae bacterium]